MNERERIRRLRWLFEQLPTPARHQRHRPKGSIPTHADVLNSTLAQLTEMIVARRRLMEEGPFPGWNFVADALARDEAMRAKVQAALDKEKGN